MTKKQPSSYLVRLTTNHGIGIGSYSHLLETVKNLPDLPPNGVKFELHKARDGPVCINLPDSLMLNVKMTTDHKAVMDIILYSV